MAAPRTLTAALSAAAIAVAAIGMVVAAPPGRPTGASRTVRLVGLGDSITAAAACPGCTAFLDPYGRGSPASAAAADAKVITVTIGANDFAPMLDTYLAGPVGVRTTSAASGPNSPTCAAT